MLEAVDGLNLATEIEVLCDGKEVLDAGVGIIVAAEDLLCLLDPVCVTCGQSICPALFNPCSATYLSGW